jgi:hypothetical protein
VGEGADRKFVLAEEVLVVGGDERARQLVDLGVGGFADGLSQRLGLGELVGGERRGRHAGLLGKGAFPDNASNPAHVYKDSTNFQDAHRHGREFREFS